MKSNKERGFTLVELIIVIAVIGVLAAILIPVFANVVEKANAKSALSDAKNALEIYIADYTDGTGDLTIGEGSVFKIKKGNKDWYYTYFNGALHDGTGDEGSDPLRPVPIPAGAVKCMASDSVYASERDADTEICDNMPKTVIIYNTHSDAPYTPHVIPDEAETASDGYILITAANQLTTEFFTEHGWDSNYRVANNITLLGEREPITGTFTGIFDGNGKTVSGLTINKPDGEKIALFSEFNGNMHDFTLNVSSVTGRLSVGSIAGLSTDATFTNVHVNISGEVKGEYSAVIGVADGDVGGICGAAIHTDFTRCGVKGSIIGPRLFGGIAGEVTGSVKECYFVGSFTSSFFEGDVYGVGGIAGTGYDMLIENCHTHISCDLSAGCVGTLVSGVIGYIGADTTIRCCVITFGDVVPPSIRTQPAVVTYNNDTPSTQFTIENCYSLTGNPFITDRYSVFENGTQVASFSQANCPGLSTSVWDFSGEHPTLINNHE